jgi:hypothetical protein
MKRWFFSLLLLCAVPAWPQQASTPAVTVPAQASVRFSFDWNPGIPWQKYFIEVQSDGKTHFDGTPGADETRDTDPYRQDFTMSEANRQKIFELAQKLNYFQSDFDSHLKHIAQTGKKTLQYQSAPVQGVTTYNWSQNANVEELTRLFEGIANTIDYGRKLAFQYRFDKLGMNQRLKELQEMEGSHNVEELQVLAPMLRKIADDPNMMNISRQTAKHLLQAAGQSGLTAQNPAQD